MLRNKFGVWALALGAVASWPTSAQADSVVVLDNYSIERAEDRDSDEEPQTISLKDCEENYDVLFPLNVTFTGGRQILEVFVGPESCLDREVRLDECHLVFAEEIGADNPSIRIPSESLVGEGEGCESARSGSVAASATMLFAFEGDNGEPEAEGSDELTIKYDVVAPDPPHVTSLGQGDGQLSAKWDPLEGEDVTGYRFYCQESATTQEEVDAGGFDQDGAGGQGGAANGGGCQSTMVAGERPPPEAFFCGEQSGKTAGRGTVEGLTNDRVYTVGVSAQDIVGNEGELSNLLCQYPKEVTDFYEAYTDAGGNGGGGFCSLGHRRGATPWSAMVLLGLALRWARRRRLRP